MKASALLQERLLIVAAAAIYLVVFNQTLPHGDALRIVRQIDTRDLIWNPNHLLFDPLGYGVYLLLVRWFPRLTALGSFELLSAISAVVSLLLFHMILVRIGVGRAVVRLAATSAVFASASFLHVAVSQYYFMVQMPLLLLALYLYFSMDGRHSAGSADALTLTSIGALLGVATAIMFNNLLLVLSAGIGVAWMGRSFREFSWHRALRLYFGAAAVGLPIFLVGYFLADVESGFPRWLLSYQGDADSTLNEVFGAKWSFYGLIRGAAMISYTFLVDCLVDTAGLGTVLWIIVSGQPLEFVPEWGRIVVGALAIPVAALLNAWILISTLRSFSNRPTVRFLALWILAYCSFNFLWNVGDEIFWFQIVPVLWILALYFNGAATRLSVPEIRGRVSTKDRNGKALALTVIAAIFLSANTVNTVAPGADPRFEQKQAAHAALLQDGDLEIFPGWDRQKWLMLPDSGPKVEQLLIMNMAVAAKGSDEQLSQLPARIHASLGSGQRVVVARVFDLDHDLRPWYALTELGWPRDRVQALFEGFCNRRIAVIEGVVFREIVFCDRQTRISPDRKDAAEAYVDTTRPLR